MGFREDIESNIEQLVLPLVAEQNYELVDVEYVKEAGTLYLRIYIDKEGGITVDDCEIISRALEAILDVQDPIKDPYILEVSSPGLDRPLKKEKDFVRSVGKAVEVKLYKTVDGQKEFVGKLIAYDEETVTIEIEKKTVTWNRSDIGMIRLAVIF